MNTALAGLSPDWQTFRDDIIPGDSMDQAISAGIAEIRLDVIASSQVAIGEWKTIARDVYIVSGAQWIKRLRERFSNDTPAERYILGTGVFQCRLTSSGTTSLRIARKTWDESLFGPHLNSARQQAMPIVGGTIVTPPSQEPHGDNHADVPTDLIDKYGVSALVGIEPNSLQTKPWGSPVFKGRGKGGRHQWSYSAILPALAIQFEHLDFPSALPKSPLKRLLNRQ